MNRLARMGLWIMMSAAATLCAQFSQQADSLFYRGVDAYKKGQFRNALQTLQSLDRIYPGHQRTTGSLLLQGKALYKLQDYPTAKAVFEKLLSNYPESRYVEDARMGLACVYYRQNLFRESVLQLIRIKESEADSKAARKAERLASDILYYRMNTDELKGLLREINTEGGKAAVTVELARQEIDNQEAQNAEQLLGDFLRLHPKNAYADAMKQLLDQVQRAGKGVEQIGVILPLTGALAEQGKSLLAGIEFAVGRQNEKGPVKFELIVKNSESKMLLAIKAAQELCKNAEVVGIIGDLESSTTLAAAAVAQENGVAFLAPTAMEDGIASVGSCVFQLNGSLSIRAEKLAETAVKSLGLKRFAILYPADDYGKRMDSAFSERITSLGGKIIAEKWYYEDTQDLGPQFKAIREAGIRQMIQDSSLNLAGKWWLSSKSAVDRLVSEYVDSTAVTVTSIDGFFMPIYKGHLEGALSQLAFNNFKTQIFGSASWDAADVLASHSDVADGTLYVSDFYPDAYSPQYNDFRNAFRKTTGKMPEKWSVLGYDAAQFLFETAGRTPLSRKDLCDKLAGVSEFKGMRGTLNLSRDRVNTSVTILQYQEGKIFKVQ